MSALPLVNISIPRVKVDRISPAFDTGSGIGTAALINSSKQPGLEPFAAQ
jgi:hypothetical protein